MEKYRIINCRSFKYLSTNSRYSIKSDKENKTKLVIDVTNNGGELSFNICNSSKEVVYSLINPESGEYYFELGLNQKYEIQIKSKAAIGNYKIQLKTTK